ncbi:MAG: glycosyltransferase [bacterium]|nr:glycosyltransferase [bacterium]
MIKVLYIITKADIGGAQKYVHDLSANLDKNQFDSKIIFGQKDLRWLSNKIWPFFINDWLAIIELIKLYKKERPDIIHLNSSKAGVLGSLAAKIYKVKCHMLNVKCSPPKVVFTAHGWVFNPTNELSFPIRWFYILLHKFSALFQDKIICVSEYDYNLALKYKIAPKNKLTTIHNGIDPNMKFLSKEEARKEIANKIPNSKFLIPNSNYPWIGSIGRLVKEKNYETLIQSAALIPNAYFFIIGEGPELKKLNVKCQMSNVNSRFFFINPTGNDAEYLKAFDIFVMSSIKEGLPYILLEAMAAELPIVVTEAGGIPEMIKNHENGLMVAQKDSAILAGAINGLITNKTIGNELGKMAQKAVLEKFSLEKMVSKTESVYKENL